MLLSGLVLILYLVNLKLNKSSLKNIGMVVGGLLIIYGLILSIQPDEYIAYTKTTISDKNITK
jgi:hypothetical protein